MGRPLKIAKAQAVITITATTTGTNVVTTNANFTNLGIIAGMPFIPATSTGNLVAGTMYWILTVLNSGNNSTFKVSATQLSANPTYTAFALSTTGPVTVVTTVAPADGYFNNPNGGVGYPATNANTYSVVGGNTAIYGKQVQVGVSIGVNGVGTITTTTADANLIGIGTDFANTLSDGDVITSPSGVLLGIIDDIANANADFATFAASSAANVTDSAFVYATPETGYIIRQKGKQKYLVKGTTTGLTGACYTANAATAALLPNQMNIVATYANSATVNVQSLSDHTAELFTATSGPVATGNIVLANANPAYTTFNTAYAANTYGSQPYPIVTITGV